MSCNFWKRIHPLFKNLRWEPLSLDHQKQFVTNIMGDSNCKYLHFVYPRLQRKYDCRILRIYKCIIFMCYHSVFSVTDTSPSKTNLAACFWLYYVQWLPVVGPFVFLPTNNWKYSIYQLIQQTFFVDFLSTNHGKIRIHHLFDQLLEWCFGFPS